MYVYKGYQGSPNIIVCFCEREKKIVRECNSLKEKGTKCESGFYKIGRYVGSIMSKEMPISACPFCRLIQVQSILMNTAWPGINVMNTIFLLKTNVMIIFPPK
jgi:hypothetical protein